MRDIIVSRYVMLFEHHDLFLLYNSKNNSFLELSKDLYYDLQKAQNNLSDEIFNNKQIVDTLLKQGIICKAEDDNAFLEQIVLKDTISSYSNDYVSLTFAPTIWCNLKCPYCYETQKFKGIITEDICNKVLEFIQLQRSKILYLSWYGGEPLLAIDRIEYFLNILRKANIKLVEHTIITNGTLLKGKALDVFDRYPLDSIQITLDGLKAHHDKVRIRHDGTGTFDDILNNLDVFVRRFPNTNVSVRVNTGKHNLEDFIKVDDLVKDRFGSHAKITVYPGILEGDNDCGFTNNFFTNSELAEFYSILLKKGIMTDFPKIAQKGCCATTLNSYVIGPQGEIYKCWEDVGFDDRIIGSVVDNHFHNRKLYQRYMLHGSFRDDKTCMECNLLPVCNGGCPHHRLENKYNGKEKNLCVYYKLDDSMPLKDLLYLYYLKTKKAK